MSVILRGAYYSLPNCLVKRKFNKVYADQNKNDTEQTLKSKDSNIRTSADIRGDKTNLAILFFLYLLQGLPSGLIAAIPIILQNHGISYRQQAGFSIVYWPFSLKLLWAPIVDSLYIKKFGRRKSWIIPVQILIGSFMVYLSFEIDNWLGGNGETPNVRLLTATFFILNCLGATQDIAIDGWCLSLLKGHNICFAPVCKCAGQTAGYFLGSVTFMTLESKNFCNKYLRSVPKDRGLITLSEFLLFWVLIMLVGIILVGLFKRETDLNGTKSENLGPMNGYKFKVLQSYRVLADMVQMRPFQILAAVMLTVRVPFAATEAVLNLKLADSGVPRDKLALLNIPILLLQFFLPLVVNRFSSRSKPLNIFLMLVPFRLIFASTTIITAFFTTKMIRTDHIPSSYYLMLILSTGFYQMTVTSMYVILSSFFAAVSDPANGGTYMTFLNTFNNLGRAWPNTVALWLVEKLTMHACYVRSSSRNSFKICYTEDQRKKCYESGGEYKVFLDGFYIESILCFILGIVWLCFASKSILGLQNLKKRAWLTTQSRVQLDRAAKEMKEKLVS